MFTLAIPDDDLTAAAHDLAESLDDAPPAPVIRAALMSWLVGQVSELLDGAAWHTERCGEWERIVRDATRRPPELRVQYRPWPWLDYSVELWAGGRLVECATSPSLRHLAALLRGRERWRGVPVVMRYYPRPSAF